MEYISNVTGIVEIIISEKMLIPIRPNDEHSYYGTDISDFEDFKYLVDCSSLSPGFVGQQRLHSKTKRSPIQVWSTLPNAVLWNGHRLRITLPQHVCNFHPSRHIFATFWRISISIRTRAQMGIKQSRFWTLFLNVWTYVKLYRSLVMSWYIYILYPPQVLTQFIMRKSFCSHTSSNYWSNSFRE